MSVQVLNLFVAQPHGHLTGFKKINQMNGEGAFCAPANPQRQNDRAIQADSVSCQHAQEGDEERHGAAAGGYLVATRILRCHPWCDGGCDPVPEQPPLLFTRLFSKTRP